MRMSCNGCRVLRKGCSNNCSIKPCLQWIKAPEAQSNATLFLAKFYGRAGLINLLNAGPHHLRPAIFKSLLYEACGRIVNPVSGSVGLAWSGSWRLCDAAVEAVLRGEPITQFAPSSDHLDLKACDIRHVSKDANNPAGDRGLHKVRSSPASQFKRSAPKPKLPKEKPAATAAFEFLTGSGTVSGSMILDSGVSLGPSHSPDHDHGLEGDTVSVETVEASLAKLDEPSDGSDVELDLTLGFK